MSETSAASDRRSIWVPPGHYYSPIVDVDALNADRSILTRPRTLSNLSLHPERQWRLFVELAAGGFGRFALSEAAVSGKRFFWGNPFFSYPDAAAYASLIERFRPSQIIEVGSGFSSALALDVLERQGVSVQLTFIEPDPARLIELTFPADAPRFRLIRSSVQDIDLSLFRSLGAGDFLLIDSTQVAKTGGDVLYEAFFKSSPR